MEGDRNRYSEVASKISFHFQPYFPEQGKFAVEKSEGGRKRRYLSGIASGPKYDGHGERMTEKCIKSFMDQANNGDILLYPDIHGVRGTDDIGILTKAEILPNGDWYTEYRLYDEDDGVGPSTLERVEKMWRQLNGLQPYTRPRQKGFSIEGTIPEGGIAQMSSTGKRVMDNVLLDGVVIVPRPAYKDSIAHAVYKALGETAPWVVRKDISTRLREKLGQQDDEREYFKRKYDLQEVLDEIIQEIMGSEQIADKAERLKTAFEEYSQLMIELIVNTPQMFPPQADDGTPRLVYRTSDNKQLLFKSLFNEMTKLEKSLEARSSKNVKPGRKNSVSKH